MAAEDDKKFDAVLGGFLVNDLRVRAGHLHCPESDTLATYHERSLLPEEMNSWKEHIVGCARCQAILAELEATDSIPLQVTEKEEVVTAASARTEAAGAPSSLRREAPATLPEKSRVTPISLGVRRRWLVPAGALAAGLLVWIAWRQNRTHQVVKTPTEITTAKLEPPATPLPSVTSDERQSASADEAARVSKDQGAVGGVVSTKPAPQTESLKPFEKSDSRAKVALAKPIIRENPKGLESSMPPADKEAGARAGTALDSLSANRTQKQPAQDTKAGVAGSLTETVEVQTPTANAQPQNQQNLQAQQSQLNEQKASGPNPSSHLEQTKKSKVESPSLTDRKATAPPAASPPGVPAPAAAFNEDASLPLAGAISPHLIFSPNRKTLWRAGHAGMIEFSNDGGALWSRQISNVSAELTAGSAPSDKICWIVGRAGTILLSSDAGAHWATVHSPLVEDLGGVRATDALHATIWNLANMKVFETSDGGATWEPATSQ